MLVLPLRIKQGEAPFFICGVLMSFGHIPVSEADDALQAAKAPCRLESPSNLLGDLNVMSNLIAREPEVLSKLRGALQALRRPQYQARSSILGRRSGCDEQSFKSALCDCRLGKLDICKSNVM